MYEMAAAYAQRLSVSCNADWWQAKGAENAERRQEAERLVAESERTQRRRKLTRRLCSPPTRRGEQGGGEDDHAVPWFLACSRGGRS